MLIFHLLVKHPGTDESYVGLSKKKTNQTQPKKKLKQKPHTQNPKTLTNKTKTHPELTFSVIFQIRGHGHHQ